MPVPDLRLERHGKDICIHDPIRRKFVALTPEELVRQCFVAWMTDSLGYPASLIANEVGITLNNTRKRCDTVVYDSRTGRPAMIVEYKAPTVKITQTVFEQIRRYSMVLKPHLLVVSNGMEHYCCVMDYERGNAHFLEQVPDYNAMSDIIESLNKPNE